MEESHYRSGQSYVESDCCGRCRIYRLKFDEKRGEFIRDIETGWARNYKQACASFERIVKLKNQES